MNRHAIDRFRAGAAQTPVEPAEDRLDSWREIAAYVRRSVRTVQRWERDGGLPVHRLHRDKRSVVFAFRSEIDNWWLAQCPGADDEAEEPVAVTAASNTPEIESGRHRWFMASPGPLWFLIVLFALAAWIVNLTDDRPRLPDSSAHDTALSSPLAQTDSPS